MIHKLEDHATTDCAAGACADKQRSSKSGVKRHAGRERRAEALARFVAGYARKRGGRGRDPNDRKYDGDLAAKVGRMAPGAFDALLRDGEEE